MARLFPVIALCFISACQQTEIIEREVTVTQTVTEYICQPTEILFLSITRAVCDLTPPVPLGTHYDTVGMAGDALVVIEYRDSVVYPNARFTIDFIDIIESDTGTWYHLLFMPEASDGYHRWWLWEGYEPEVNEVSPSKWYKKGVYYTVRHRHHYGGPCSSGRSININL